jgi:hypothetical protein
MLLFRKTVEWTNTGDKLERDWIQVHESQVIKMFEADDKTIRVFLSDGTNFYTKTNPLEMKWQPCEAK